MAVNGEPMTMRESRQKNETRLERMERWFRNEPIIAVVMLIGICVIGVSEVVKHGSDLLIAVGLKHEKTLELAKDTAKAEFSRRLIELAWRRLFWTRNFVRRVELSRPPLELDYSWNKYLDSVADWSADLMVNINGLEQYYAGTEKPSQFNAIQAKFLNLEDLLVKLRSVVSKSETPNLIAETKALIDEVNADLYYFALNRHAPPTAFASGTCEVKVFAPLASDRVGSQAEVRGTAKIPNGTYLWVFSHRKGMTVWWPQNGRPVSTNGNGEWVTIARFGAAQEVEQPFEFAVAVVDADTDNTLESYGRSRDSGGGLPPITFPKTVEGCPSTIVTVNKTSH
jgi:hypothetical protein